MWPLLLALAGTVVESPCGLMERALARDALAPADVHLREAATQAESAGDVLLAMKLLSQLKTRTRDDAVAADAAFMLETLDPRASEFSCRAVTRDVVVFFDMASLLSDAEQRLITELLDEDLDRTNATAIFEPAGEFLDCIDLDDRCVRLALAERKLGGVMQVKGIRFENTFTIEVVAVGFKGRTEHRFVLDDDNRRWKQVLDRPALDDIDAILPAGASRGARIKESPFNPAIAGVTAIGLGLVVAGAGTALAIEPNLATLVGISPLNDLARERLRLIGLGSIGVGAAVVVASTIATALIVDARNDG